MKKIILLCFSACFVLAVLSGCHSRGIVLADKTSNGDLIKMTRGEVLIVSLEGNPTTGYIWEISGVDERLVRPIGKAEFRADSRLCGAPGINTFRFKAVRAGRTIIRLVYHRPWERGVKPFETYYLQIEVR